MNEKTRRSTNVSCDFCFIVIKRFVTLDNYLKRLLKLVTN